jgi:glutathione S-transferase
MSGHIPKLYHFLLSTRAEFARLLFEDTKTPYESVKVTFGEHMKYDKLPFGQLPILEEDGFVLAQSATIARYVAKKVGLYPADAKEAATAGMIEYLHFIHTLEMMLDAANDLYEMLISVQFKKIMTGSPQIN